MSKQSHPSTVEGKFFRGKGGVGYVRSKEIDEVIEIPAHQSGTALHRDVVIAEITKRQNETSFLGKITEVIRRNNRGFAGVLRHRGGRYQVTPDHNKDSITLFIPDADIADAAEDDYVFVELVDWKSVPIGRIIRRLEALPKHEQEMQSIALSKGFDQEFPDDVTHAAKQLYEMGIPEPGGDRRDLRDLPTFTIDPDDAKDFDDALSLRDLGDGTYELGVHIADVAHYVQPDTPLDIEAQHRATSVYMVDRVLPMLPEVLSNDLCSLRPNEDRAAFSALFVVNTQGQVQDRWFGRSVINSNKRFTYKEAQEVLDTKSGPFANELGILDTITQNMRQARADAGALMLESTEMQFVLDENGKPLSVHPKEHLRTQELIEECMLTANREVADFLGNRKDGFCVYRVHPRPSYERVEELAIYLRSLGFEPKIQNGVIASDALVSMLERARSDIERDAISMSIARSMEKAFYSTEQDDHYGLGFEHYTHFTSPIRRYPDIMVHRLLHMQLTGQVPSNKLKQAFASMVTQSNQREIDAQEAERASTRVKQIEFLADRINQVRDGVITGMTERGIFVRDTESYAEGMLRLSDIPGDYYAYNPKLFQIEGKKTKKIFRLGDPIKIRIKRVNSDLGFVDFDFVEK